MMLTMACLCLLHLQLRVMPLSYLLKEPFCSLRSVSVTDTCSLDVLVAAASRLYCARICFGVQSQIPVPSGLMLPE